MAHGVEWYVHDITVRQKHRFLRSSKFVGAEYPSWSLLEWCVTMRTMTRLHHRRRHHLL